jgi:hypothetical protein
LSDQPPAPQQAQLSVPLPQPLAPLPAAPTDGGNAPEPQLLPHAPPLHVPSLTQTRSPTASFPAADTTLPDGTSMAPYPTPTVPPYAPPGAPAPPSGMPPGAVPPFMYPAYPWGLPPPGASE